MLGLDPKYVGKIDPTLSLGRISTDVRTDLIYAPHFSAIFAKIPDELWDILERDLKAGQFEPSLPLTLETPKPSGLTRPGSIHYPLDRLLYQVLVDQIAPIGEKQIDRNRVFSNVLIEDDHDFQMFRPHSETYSEMKAMISTLASKASIDFVLRTDVTSFFERIYHHNLINFLDAAGCDKRPVRALEKVLFAWTQKDSHGIIQGVFPSDFLGNIYLCPLDADLENREISSTRYVDDLYLFFRNQDDAKRYLVSLCSHLRREGLTLNEAKTSVTTTEDVVLEETALDRMFDKARKEFEAEEESTFDNIYGFAAEWTPVESEEESEENGEDVEIKAVRSLFEERRRKPYNLERIDKFCLPILAAAKSDIAIEVSLKGIIARPHMAQIYCGYLAAFVRHDLTLVRNLSKLLLTPTLLYDSQRMWILACLLQSKMSDPTAVKDSLTILRTDTFSETVRALAAIYVGSHGTAAQRRILKMRYTDEGSPYVRGAILYSSRYFPTNEREACLTSWGGHTPTNTLIAKTVKKLLS